jgi:hypothetical protein
MKGMKEIEAEESRKVWNFRIPPSLVSPSSL